MKAFRQIGVIAIVLFCLRTALADTLPPEEPIPNAIGARLNNEALQQIANQFITIITVEMVEQMVFQMNPLYFEDIGWAWISIDTTNVSFDEPISVSINGSATHPGKVEIQVMMEDLLLNIAATGYMDILFGWPGDFGAQGTLSADRLTVIVNKADITVGTNGVIDVALNDVDVEFDNFNIDIDVDFLDSIVDAFGSAIEGAVADAIQVAIVDMIPPYLEEFLNELELAMTLEVFGIPLHFEMIPQNIPINAEGVTVWLRMNVTSDGTSGCVPPQPGSRYTFAVAPNYNRRIPGSNEYYGVALSISDDAINRALFTAYSSGLLCFTIDAEMMDSLGLPFPITSGLFSAAVPRMNQFATNAPLILVTRPQYPPEAQFKSNSQEFPLRLDIQDLYIDIYIYAWDRYMHFFTLSLDLTDFRMAVSFVQETNSIHIDLGTEFGLTTEVVWDELMHLTESEKTSLESVLPTIVNLIMPLLAGSISDFPLPDFQGYSVGNAVIMTHGDGNGWLGFFGDLVINPTDLIQRTQHPMLLPAQAHEEQVISVE